MEALRCPPPDTAVSVISGGERRRVALCRLLLQEPDVLLLDEPTTYLDLAHQLEVLELLVKLNEEGKTIIMVLHDLNHAAHYADHLVALSNGKIAAQGNAYEVITEEIVRSVFRVESRIIPHPVTGTPMCLPLGQVAA
jgi:iron complex transport system ATP-binding protein